MDRADHDWFRFAGESRVKQSSSVMRAMAQNALSQDALWKIDDIVGVRAVVLTRKDAQELAEKIRLGATRLRDVSRYDLDEPSGYRGIHVKGWYDGPTHPIGCEIQIRSELQDAWAVVSRHDIYGNETLLDFVKRAAKIQADHLAAIDEAFELIQHEARRPPAVQPVASQYDARNLDRVVFDAGRER